MSNFTPNSNTSVLKKTTAISLILLIFLQLAGGANIAYAFTASRLLPLPVNNTGEHYSKTQLNKGFNFSQFQEVEDTEEDVAKNASLQYNHHIPPYNYTPIFSAKSKHFLIHFGSAIKDKLPCRSILYCSFLI